MKLCRSCVTYKPDSDFAFRSKAKGTRSSECKQCHRKVRNRVYAANPISDRRRARDRRRQIKEWLDAYRGDRKCPCGEGHPGCLDFHHLDPKAKDLSVSDIAQQGWGRARILRELAKCQILCANCHRKVHWAEHSR